MQTLKRGLALWYSNSVMLASHIGSLVCVLAGLFLTWLPANVPEKATEGDSSVWAPATNMEDSDEGTVSVPGAAWTNLGC